MNTCIRKDLGLPRVPNEMLANHGYFLNRDPHPCTLEELQKAIRNNYLKRPMLAWEPRDTEGAPPIQITSLQHIVRSIFVSRIGWLSILLIFAGLEFLLAAILNCRHTDKLSLTNVTIAMTCLLGGLISQETYRFTASNYYLDSRIFFFDWLRYRTQFATIVIILLIGLIWIFITLLNFAGIYSTEKVVEQFSIIPEAVLHGQWFRLITGPLIHVNLGHIALNVFGLCVYGSLAEKISNARMFVVVLLVSMLAGALGTAFLSSYSASIGISGAIYGLGAFGVTYQSRSLPPMPLKIKSLILMSLISGLLISFFEATHYDVFTHCIGAGTGLSLGYMFNCMK